ARGRPAAATFRALREPYRGRGPRSLVHHEPSHYTGHSRALPKNVTARRGGDAPSDRARHHARRFECATSRRLCRPIRPRFGVPRNLLSGLLGRVAVDPVVRRHSALATAVRLRQPAFSTVAAPPAPHP